MMTNISRRLADGRLGIRLILYRNIIIGVARDPSDRDLPTKIRGGLRSPQVMITAPLLSEALILPILSFIKSYGPQSRSSPLVLGISGPQGSGKTTLAN